MAATRSNLSALDVDFKNCCARVSSCGRRPAWREDEIISCERLRSKNRRLGVKLRRVGHEIREKRAKRGILSVKDGNDQLFEDGQEYETRN